MRSLESLNLRVHAVDLGLLLFRLPGLASTYPLAQAVKGGGDGG
jgi:hypothetical protein